MERIPYACFGDSITSNQVTGIGTRVAELLDLEMVGNYACGYATCSDWHVDDKVTTPISLIEPPNTNTADNVLSNQVRRILQDTTPCSEVITWEHPLEGEFSIDPKIGVGLSHSKKPKLIYIAIGTNDGNTPENPIIDNTEEVLSQRYSELDRCSIASALRWAIETLISAFPEAVLFVASPLHATCELEWMNYENVKLKRDIIERICRFEGVHFIDSFYESGYNRLTTIGYGGVHPEEPWKENIARFIAGKIREGYCLD